MKTIKEMIEVMLAYERGQRIEYTQEGQDLWEEALPPEWDWVSFDYRIMEKVYVPFESAEEFLAAQRKYDDRLISPYFIGPLKFNDIYINSDGLIFIRVEDKRGVRFDYYGDLKDLFEKFKFADGKPCGKEVPV